ncbi:MAG: response regulator [Chloroflexi bacterium]|jgi:two-component system nitrate/nitrite response regulator NarL|nr:response regulator [Chloroflexota bacterium]
MKIRVVLADDHPPTRQGIRAALERAPDIDVVGEAGDGAAAKKLVAKLGPDILLLDLVMPGPKPTDIERWVRHNHPETITLILTAHDRDALLAEMEAAGAAGFLTKDEDTLALVTAIRRAAQGEALYTPEQMERTRRWREEVGQRWESLTEREREVLRELVAGQSNSAIAETLSVAKKTVEYHVTNILRKLGVASRLEAAAWVHDHIPDDLWDDEAQAT